MTKKVLNAHLLYCLFDSANMHRWNDHLRTVDLTELDKQAHKAAIAWVLGKYEETEGGSTLDWNRIIEHSLFSFIQRLVMTDLKPQVFHRIIADKFDEVNDYVLSYFDENVPDSDPGFRERLETYYRTDKSSKEDDIIRAAHYLATRWEFNTIYDANRSMYGIEQTRTEIDEQIFQHMDLIGVKKLLENRSSLNFVDLISQLRFQQRWARTPRIPKTTVLGHSLIVADMIYLNDVDNKADPKQIYNNFYTALFHDLPEVLTKDVITPVKLNVGGLAVLLESYERELVQSKILPLIPESWHKELEFMVYDPFVDIDDERGKRTGKDIKACDLMAAYIEAHVSICHGISSKTLKEGEKELRVKLKEVGKEIGAEDLILSFDGLQI
ncbi:MAG: HD domain-containing protein [Candidatus Methanoplasma sp.]|jgi:putative hydrolase of HD superfamily|nr:HD domain-containing protein [Candidatus Methanoplasma sp.]